MTGTCQLLEGGVDSSGTPIIVEIDNHFSFIENITEVSCAQTIGCLVGLRESPTNAFWLRIQTTQQQPWRL